MKNQRSTRRRLAIAIVICFAVVAIFGGRLVDIQVVQAETLKTQSFDKRAIAQTLYAPRGEIVDADGTVLADSVTRYDVTASPRNVEAKGFERTVKGKKTTVSPQDASGEIAAVTGQSADAVYSSLTKNPKSDYVLVASAVTTADMRKLQALHIPYLYFQNHPIRTYPDGAVAGNLIGFMGTDGPSAGLELSDDKCLASTNGSQTYERGADGVQIPGSSVTTKAAKPGGTLKLTIDGDLQWYAQQAIQQQGQAIGAQSATAVVFEVKTGHILAAADWPSVDPNDFNATPDPATLYSQLFQQQYEPGSVFKGMSAAILIDTGHDTPTTGVTVPWSYRFPNGARVNDAEVHAPERLTLTGVLQQSSNVGISMLGGDLSQKVRDDYMKKFGLGTPTGAGLNTEASGSIQKLPWDNQTNYNVLYGQGVAATALQVANIYQTLGNGGVRIPLTMIAGCTSADGKTTDAPSGQGTRVVKDSTAKTVVNMLESVVDSGPLSSGTKIPGYRVAGKSGTAEVPENGVYSSDRIVSFVGIAPATDPQYGVLVTYTKPTTMKTSSAAAPTFKKIMTQVLTKYHVPPSTTPSTYPATTW